MRTGATTSPPLREHAPDDGTSRAARMAGLPVLVLLLILALPAPAPADPDIEAPITLQAVTHQGREFHRLFTKFFEPPPGARGYAIHIRERADPRWGSMIEVTLNDMVAWRRLFGVRGANLETYAKQAAEACQQILLAMLLRDPGVPGAGDGAPRKEDLTDEEL